MYRFAADEYLVIANAANRLTVLDALTLRSEGLQCSVVDRTPHRARTSPSTRPLPHLSVDPPSPERALSRALLGDHGAGNGPLG